ncbi:hypothetical protein [Alkalihalobacterium bogoriense]|uniref:hypothetical protein n=1 Tax=Alkalihalobacterium bogoriense TaxID=246272 RepID=UPI000478BBDA|nr:hypothetical protein [Alkalihalobacterium bogoriense]
MEWTIFFVILSSFFLVLSSFKFYQLWSEFKKLNIGDKLSIEMAERNRKRISGTVTFLGTGIVLGIVGVLL